jgi:hypothetical protein
MNTKLFLPVLFLLAIIGSCQKDDTINFTLYLNNDAGNIKIFKVSVDGKVISNEEISSAGTLPITFPVESGKHILKAAVVGQSDFFESTVDFVKSKKYGYMDYRSETGKFDFFLSSSGGID